MSEVLDAADAAELRSPDHQLSSLRQHGSTHANPR